MSTLATTLVVLVAALHVWFLVLEMFLWTRPIGLRAFRNTVETARSKRILYVQAVPALVALVVVLLRY